MATTPEREERGKNGKWLYPLSNANRLKHKLHLFDLLYNKLYNKSTTNLPSTTNPQNLDKSRCYTTNRKPPASPQQIKKGKFEL